MKLATIGYERETQGAVIDRLKAAGVEVVIDVRAVASSRRAGFSKTLLSASLNEAGHRLRAPAPARHAQARPRAPRARAAIAEMHEIFEAHMAEPAAQLELAKATEIARGQEGRPALLRGRRRRLPPHRSWPTGSATTLGCEIENL